MENFTPSRRSFLVGATAAALAPLPLIAAPATAQGSPGVDRQLARYHRLCQALEDCSDAGDFMHPDYGGPEAEERVSRLNALIDETISRLLAAPNRSAADVAAKGRFLVDYLGGCTLTDDQIFALAASLASCR